MPWYCPKCGEVAVEQDGIWSCRSGRLQFSKSLGDRLAVTYAQDFMPGQVADSGLRPPNGFCPACC